MHTAKRTTPSLHQAIANKREEDEQGRPEVAGGVGGGTSDDRAQRDQQRAQQVEAEPGDNARWLDPAGYAARPCEEITDRVRRYHPETEERTDDPRRGFSQVGDDFMPVRQGEDPEAYDRQDSDGRSSSRPMTTSKLDGDLAGRITCPERRSAGRSAAWLARLPWEQEVTSSNLVAPIRGPPVGRPAGPRDRPGIPPSNRRREEAFERDHPHRFPQGSGGPRRGDAGPGWDDRRPRIGLDGRADGPAPRRPRRAPSD